MENLYSAAAVRFFKRPAEEEFQEMVEGWPDKRQKIMQVTQLFSALFRAQKTHPITVCINVNQNNSESVRVSWSQLFSAVFSTLKKWNQWSVLKAHRKCRSYSNPKMLPSISRSIREKNLFQLRGSLRSVNFLSPMNTCRYMLLGNCVLISWVLGNCVLTAWVLGNCVLNSWVLGNCVLTSWVLGNRVLTSWVLGNSASTSWVIKCNVCG